RPAAPNQDRFLGRSLLNNANAGGRALLFSVCIRTKHQSSAQRHSRTTMPMHVQESSVSKTHSRKFLETRCQSIGNSLRHKSWLKAGGDLTRITVHMLACFVELVDMRFRQPGLNLSCVDNAAATPFPAPPRTTDPRS